MRTEYNNALKKYFQEMLASRLPGFQLTKINSKYKSPGELFFVNTVDDALKLFIIISQHAKGADRFTVELGWSIINDFPQLSMRPNAETPEQININNTSEYICRIGTLIDGKDKWWSLKDSSILRIKDPIQKLIAQSTKVDANRISTIVEPKVKDAIEKLSTYGFPFFEKVRSLLAQ
ncbi:MAG: hypothetical protein R3E90_09570 [Marinicella sp.]